MTTTGSENEQSTLPTTGVGSMVFGEATSVDLLVSARAGDAGAMDRLFRRYLSPLRRWSRGRLPTWARDLVDTDDLVQDVLVRSLQNLDRFEAERSGAFQSYLRQAVLNRIRDQMRRVARRPLLDGTAGHLADPAPSPIEEAIGRERMHLYEEALERLRTADREAIVSRFELDFDYHQIALALDKPSEDAARMAVKRAIVRLARTMSELAQGPDSGSADG